MPKFANTLAWQQAELLMQPVFIRVIDNIRKQLEQSNWKGTYQDVELWPDGVSDETKELVRQLQQQMETAPPERAEAIEEQLARLPRPHPGYLLCLERGGRKITVDLWQLCYQICFRNYSPVLNALDQDMTVEVDTSLIDETGDVDWLRLDTKAKQLIEQIFATLSGERNDQLPDDASAASSSELIHEVNKEVNESETPDSNSEINGSSFN